MEPQNIVDLSHYIPSFWLPLFRPLTFKTRIIKANLRFFLYLSSDGIFIHPKYRKPHIPNKDSLNLDLIEENPGGPSKLPQQTATFEAISNRNNDDYSSNQDLGLEEAAFFPEFDQEIERSLQEFENSVFTKLNWKAPKDIDTWIPRLQCQSLEDILTSLKSSSIIGDMLENCFPKSEELKQESDLLACGGLEIVLRKWYDLNKAMEFRVFVKNNAIIAISQRYIKNCFKFLIEEEFKEKITTKIIGFFEEEVKSKFVDPDFVLDLYIEVRKNNGWRVWIVDLNPWGNFTNPLLFEWEELNSLQKLETRVVTKENEIILEKAAGICQTPIEFQGEVTEENVKNWVGSLSEENQIG